MCVHWLVRLLEIDFKTCYHQLGFRSFVVIGVTLSFFDGVQLDRSKHQLALLVAVSQLASRGKESSIGKWSPAIGERFTHAD